MTPEIVSTARRQFAEIAATRQAANDKVQAVRDRIAESRAALDAITARRIEGRATEGDAAEYAIVAADLAALQGILENAEAAEAAIDIAPAQNRLAVAEKQLADAHAHEVFDALALRAAALDNALVSCVRALLAEGRKIGRNSVCLNWRPSAPLKSAVEGYAP